MSARGRTESLWVRPSVAVNGDHLKKLRKCLKDNNVCQYTVHKVDT